MPRWAAKVDGNHQEIVKSLRQLGWSVLDLSRVGQGCPDLLIAKRGRTLLAEVKTPTGRLGPPQRAFLKQWNGCHCVLRSLDDVMNLNHVYE
jgi:hypothetical protein